MTGCLAFLSFRLNPNFCLWDFISCSAVHSFALGESFLQVTQKHKEETFVSNVNKVNNFNIFINNINEYFYSVQSLKLKLKHSNYEKSEKNLI